MAGSGRSHASMEERDREHGLVQGVRGQRWKREKNQTELTEMENSMLYTFISLVSKYKDLRNAFQISDIFLLEEVFQLL